jgi:hypothetical protein
MASGDRQRKSLFRLCKELDLDPTEYMRRSKEDMRRAVMDALANASCEVTDENVVTAIFCFAKLTDKINFLEDVAARHTDYPLPSQSEVMRALGKDTAFLRSKYERMVSTRTKERPRKRARTLVSEDSDSDFIVHSSDSEAEPSDKELLVSILERCENILDEVRKVARRS